MKHQSFADPFDLWKQFYDKVEDQWNQAIDQSMQREDFSKWMGQYLNGYLQYQQLVQKTASKYYEQANIPSRQDLVHVSSLVVNLEEKVDRLEQNIEDHILRPVQEIDAAKELKSLKSDMSKLTKRLDQLFDLMENRFEANEAKEKATI